MVVLIYAMLEIALLAILFAMIVFVKQKGTLTPTSAASYDVFWVSGNQLTVLAGIPVTYELDEIQAITFSAMKAPKSMSTYNGIMRVVKTNGKKAVRFFLTAAPTPKKWCFRAQSRILSRRFAT